MVISEKDTEKAWELISNGFKWIARDANDDLYGFSKKPVCTSDRYEVKEGSDWTDIDKKLFEELTFSSGARKLQDLVQWETLNIYEVNRLPVAELQALKSLIAQEFGFQESKIHIHSCKRLDGKPVFLRWEAVRYEFAANCDEFNKWRLMFRRAEKHATI